PLAEHRCLPRRRAGPRREHAPHPGVAPTPRHRDRQLPPPHPARVDHPRQRRICLRLVTAAPIDRPHREAQFHLHRNPPPIHPVGRQTRTRLLSLLRRRRLQPALRLAHDRNRPRLPRVPRTAPPPPPTRTLPPVGSAPRLLPHLR